MGKFGKKGFKLTRMGQKLTRVSLYGLDGLGIDKNGSESDSKR